MTLPSNCLPTEPSAAPSDPHSGFGPSVQPLAAAPGGPPFSSLLTQADATGATGSVPTPGTAPATTTPVQPVANIATALYPAAYYMPLVGPKAVPSVAAGTAPTTISTPTAQPQTTGVVTPGVDASAQTMSDGKKPEPSAPSMPQINPLAAYPGVYYMSRVGAQAGPIAVTGPAMDVATALVQAVGSDGQLTTAAATLTESGTEAPQGLPGVSPKEKQKGTAKLEETSGDNSAQGAMLLAYQFIAGQWVPQPTVPPSVQAQASAQPIDPQSGAKVAPAALTIASGIASLETNQPRQAPVPGQKNTVLGPATVQKNAGNDLVQTDPKVPPAPTGSVTADGVSTSAVAKADAITPASTEKTTSDLSTQLSPDKPDATLTTDLPATDSGATVSPRRFTQSRTAEIPAPEKIAGPKSSGRSALASGGNPLIGKDEKKSLSIDDKEVASTQVYIGTSGANREIAMPDSVANKPSAASFPSLANERLQSAGNVSTPVSSAADAGLSAHAPRLVQEIRQIAERISVVDRNSVEVRFDFSDSDRLSVRVEYRDGMVQTTFRTDSSQVRDAISHEWQAQGAAAEQRPYRMAEPVFSQTTSDQQNFSSQGDGSGRQRASEQPAQAPVPSFAAADRRAGATTTAAAPATRSFRPETSLHLQAFA